MTRALRMKLAAVMFATASAVAAVTVGSAAAPDRAPVREVAMNCADCEPFGGPCMDGNCTGPWPW